MSKLSVLLVDDEPDLLDMLEVTLEDDYRLDRANDGLEALEAFKRESIDAVVSDVRMPNLDGVGLLKEIRALNPLTPVVCFVTGFSDIDERKALELGATGVMSKPFDSDEIDRRVQDYVRPREQRWSGSEKPTDFVPSKLPVRFGLVTSDSLQKSLACTA